jgi:spoIIIJ-associated protein
VKELPDPAVDAEPADRLLHLLETVVDATDVDAEVRVEESEDELLGIVDADEVGLLIGHHGHTIDALQHVASRFVYRGAASRKRVVVDAGGYRERRGEILRRQADRAAADAIRYARPVALDAMVASERRVVHEYLRDRGDVDTYSEGDEPNRHLVVAPRGT